MSNTGGFDRTKKMIILISDVLLYHVSIYLAFFLRYQGDLPYNYLAYEKTRIYILRRLSKHKLIYCKRINQLMPLQ